MKAAEVQAEAAMKAAEMKGKLAKPVDMKPLRKEEPKAAVPVAVPAPAAPPVPAEAPPVGEPSAPVAEVTLQTGSFVPTMLGRWRGRKRGTAWW